MGISHSISKLSREKAERLGEIAKHNDAIKRLRQEKLIARAVDKTSGHTYFLINPRLASVGSTQRRGHLFQQFDEAIAIPKEPE